MRVVIAEDLALLRDGLTRLLRDNGFEMSRRSRTPTRCSRHATEKPDIAIVDIRLPPTFRDEGVRAAIEARRRAPRRRSSSSRSTSSTRMRPNSSRTVAAASAIC